MKLPANRERKSEQVNVRLTVSELHALERIAEEEGRDKTYVISFFIRWASEQYRRLGSFRMMSKINLPEVAEAIDVAARLKLRGEVEFKDKREDENGQRSR